MTTSPSDTIVLLDRALPRRVRFADVPPLELALGAGLHAVVGTPSDGTLAIAKLVGGIESPARGKVVVLGRSPVSDPDLRARIGVSLSTPMLPSSGKLGRFVRSIDRLRADSSASAALQRFGIDHWRDRRLADLSASELRALELVIALSTPEPVALVVTEPGVDMAPLDRATLRQELVRAEGQGTCVIVATASMADAVELCSTIHVLERGRVSRSVPAQDTALLSPGRSVVLRVEVDLPRLLVASLADDPAVAGVDWDQQDHRSTLVVRGDDLDRLALAVARAAGTSGASIRSIAPLAPGLEEVRAATSGLALAAYHAAYRSYVPAPSLFRTPNDSPESAVGGPPPNATGFTPPPGGAP